MRGATVLSNKDKQGAVHTLYPLKSTCLDDMSSAWEESFGDVSLGNFLTTRPIKMNGYTSNGDGFANSKCPGGVGPCTGYTDTTGDRTMGYYDQNFLNYYYYMASQFALSDRWFSPIESKSIPNRIATDTGGTTQGLVNDPSGDDHLSPLTINNIFQNLDSAKVSWKVYYTVNNGACDPEDCNKTQSGSSLLPASTFTYLTYAFKYVGGAPPCTAPKVPSSVVGDSSNSFCIDPTHIAPLRDPTYGYFADLKNGTLPSFGFIESGSGLNDEHPGYQQSVLAGQNQVSQIINGLMNSTSWKDSAFFLAYDEGGGPYDHVPPVPGHTNDFTDASAAANYPTDVKGISVQPDSFYPCVPTTPGTPSVHCDLSAGRVRIEHRRCRRSAAWLRLRRTGWIPSAEHGGLSVRSEALCFSRPDGPHSGHQIRRGSLYRKREIPYSTRCGATQPAGLLRLHRRALGHAANPDCNTSAHADRYWVVLQTVGVSLIQTAGSATIIADPAV